MKQFLTVLKFELGNYFQNKSFLITTLIIALLAIGAVSDSASDSRTAFQRHGHKHGGRN